MNMLMSKEGNGKWKETKGVYIVETNNDFTFTFICRRHKLFAEL